MWEAPPVRACLEVVLNLGSIHANLGVNTKKLVVSLLDSIL